MPSLRHLALNGQLPAHQNIDHETLDWIVQAGSSLLGKPAAKVLLPSELKQHLSFTSVSTSFFTSDELYAGLHGCRHAARVAVLSALLCFELGIHDRRFVRNSVLAGSLHDCRRFNDNADKGHGARSAIWFRQHAATVADYYHTDLTPDDIDMIATAIQHHDMPSHPTTAQHQILNILKTADALDRYRQPLRRWWIDERYLTIKPSLKLKKTAFELVCLSEEAYLDCLDVPLSWEHATERFWYV